jgi:hypothetical protein
VRSAIFRINAYSSEQQRSEGFSSYFFKQKSKQKAFFKFSEDFFHFTVLHENHRFRIAACFPLISQCYRMGLGAITQASRLNLGKFRGSRADGLEKLVCNEEPTSVEECFKSYK